MRSTVAILLAAALCALGAEDESQSRHFNSPPVRFWPLFEALDYGQPPTKEVEALWPLFEWERGPDKRKLHVFPVVWSGEKGKDRYLFIVPLYGQRKKADSHAELFFPLFSTVDGKAELEPYALVPHLATFVNTDKQKTLRVLGPVLRAGKGDPNADDPYAITDIVNLGGLLKILETRRDDKGADVNLLAALPFKGSAKRPKPGWSVAGPGVVSWRTFKLGRIDRESKPPYGTVDVLNLGGLLKVLESRRSKDGTNVEFASVLSFDKAAEAPKRGSGFAGPSLFGLAPIRHKSDDAKSKTHVFPVLWRGRSEGGEYFHLWPIFGVNKEGTTKRMYSVGFPLLIYAEADAKDSRLFGFPLMLCGYYRSSDSKNCWALPLAFFGRKGEDHFRMVMPVYFDFKEGTQRAKHIIPIHGFYDDGKGYRRDFVLGNIFGYARKKQTDWKQFDLAWPIAAYRTAMDESHNRLLPIWWHSKKGQERLDLFCPPLLIHSRDNAKRKVVSFPFVWYTHKYAKDDGSFVLFPLLWDIRQNGGKRRSTVLFPIAWNFRDDGKKKRSSVLFPLIWNFRNDQKQTRSSVIFPLVWGFRDDKRKTRSSVLFPFVWRFTNEKKPSRRLVIFPFIWLDKTRDDGGYHFWPLFGWRREGNSRGLSIAWPVFWYRWNPNNGMKKLGLPFPLVYWQTVPSHQSKHCRVVPFWYTRKKDDWFLSLLPLMCARKDDDFKGSAWLWYVGKPKDKQLTRRHAILWKLMTHERWRDGDYDFRILHKLIRRQKKKGYSALAINPFIRNEHDGDLYRFSFLGSTFQYENDAGAKRLRLLHFLKIPL